jgi:uncharacterized iron-regulated membrane protein
MMTTHDTQGPADAHAAGQVYRAFWRWHFYAGLLILPILMLMALTGATYLFRGEIEGVVYRSLQVVDIRPTATSPSQWVSAAERGLGGKVIQFTMPSEPGRSVRLVVDAGGLKQTAYVDPHDARFLGATPDGGVMSTVKRLHSLEIAGPQANLLVEVVAGWAIVMVFTGVFLWWPRGQKGGIVTVRGVPRGRLFWRDLHAVTGLFASAVIVFLAATGMPWSAVWGKQVRAITTEAGLGRPAAPGGEVGGQHTTHSPVAARSDAMPWALQHTGMHTGQMAGVTSVDSVVASVEAAGLGRPYVVSIPQSAGKAWTASYAPDQVEDSRTLYIDAATGKVIGDLGWREYGPAAKAIEWGISVHQGQQYGWVNRYLMLAGCVSIWLLGVSAITMWWKRRPEGRLGAPSRPANRRAYLGLAIVVVPLGLIFPLVGASLVAVLLFDLAFQRFIRAMRPAAT